MSTPSIKKNFVLSIINQIVNIAIPLILTPFTSRVFGPDGIGVYSYTTANVTYFTLFCMLGISGYGQRTIAITRDDREETSRVFWELQIIHTVLFVICSLLYLVLIFNSSEYSLYYIAQYTILVSNFFDITWLYQAFEKFDIIAIRNFIIKTVTMLAVFGFVHTKSDLVLYIFINGLAAILSNFSLWLGLKRLVDRVSLSCLNFKRHMKDIIIFFIPTIAASVYSILDKSVINWITHDEFQNGYYEQAYKILQICNILVQTLSTVSAPRMSNMFSKGNNGEFKERLNNSLKFMLLLAMPVAFGVCGIAETFVPVFFGEGYDTVAVILYIFMPMVVVLGFSVYLDGMYLVPSGKRLQSACAVIAGSCSNLVLNIVLVILWGAVGAAVATLLTEVLVASIMIYLSRKMIDWKEISKSFMKYLLCAFVMFLLVKGISQIPCNMFLSLVLQMGAGAVFYFCLLFFNKDELFLYYISVLTHKLIKGH